MTYWSDVKDKINNTIETIQKNPILDTFAISALESIPVVGKLLLKLYENSKESQEDITSKIIQWLEKMKLMNDENLEKCCRALEKNEQSILQNQKYLEKIIQDNSVILDKLEESSQEHKEFSSDMKKFGNQIAELTKEIHNIIPSGPPLDKIEDEKNSFSCSEFEIIWPKSWENISDRKMASIHKITKEYLDKQGLPYDPSVVKLSLVRIREKLEPVPSINISVDSANGKNARELLNDTIPNLERGGYQIIDSYVDEISQTYTVEMKADPNDIYSKFPKGLEIYQIQKGIVRNDKQILIACTDLSEKIFSTNPKTKKEITDIFQNLHLL